MWWWGIDGPAPWMFFIPVIMIGFVAICIAMLLFMARRGLSHLSRACCGFGFDSAHHHADGFDGEVASGAPRAAGHSAFDDYRADTLRRLEQEHKEFKDFLEHLRTAKDKAEFDQFMAQRQAPSAAPEPRLPA